jgi:hypothetical protein
MNTPIGKNVVGHEIMNRPQIYDPECEFFILVRVISFHSIPQIFKLIDQGFQHHVESQSMMVRTRYDEAKKHKFKFHVKRGRKIVWNRKHGLAGVGCCVLTERCEAISREPNENISHVLSKVWIKVV